MQKLVWQNANGVELDLTSGNYGITEWEGFSNASLNIQSQQVPFQDGGVFLDALIEQRELSVTLAMQDNNNLELRYQQRRELISALNPKLGEGYLIYTNDYTSKRIKCVAQIPLFETHNSDTVGTPKASLSWTACEPYWEDVDETVLKPRTNIVTIENAGDVPVGFEVYLSYPNITKYIYSQRQNKEIEIKSNYNEAISKVHINTNTGQKTVKTEQIFWKYRQFYTLDNSNYSGITSNVIFDGKYYFGFSERIDTDYDVMKQALFRSKDFITWEQVGDERNVGRVGYYVERWKKIISAENGTIIILTYPFQYSGEGEYYTSLDISHDGGITWSLHLKVGEYNDYCPIVDYYSKGVCVYNPKTRELVEIPNLQEGIIRIGIDLNEPEYCRVEKDYTNEGGSFEDIFIDEKGNYLLYHKSENNNNKWATFYLDWNGEIIEKSTLTAGFIFILKTEEGYYGASTYFNTTLFFHTKDLQEWSEDFTGSVNRAVNISYTHNTYFAYSQDGRMFPWTDPNIINLVTSDSDLDMQIETGSNQFTIVTSLAQGEEPIIIKYRQKYLGV